MVNQQLVNYIKAQEARGYSAQQLRNYLMQKGYNQAEVDGAIRYAGAGNTYPSQQPQQLAKQGKFGFFQKIISVIKKPKEFYNRIKAEPGIKKALIFYILLVTLALVLQIPLTIIIAFIKNKTIGTFTLLSSLFLLIAIPIALIITIPLLFIMGGLYHILVRIFKGKNPFNATFRAVVYSFIPALIFSVLTPIAQIKPYANLIGSLWWIVLLIMGIAMLQEISYTKAIIAVMIPTLILIGIILLISSALLGSPFAFLTASGSAISSGPVLK